MCKKYIMQNCLNLEITEHKQTQSKIAFRRAHNDLITQINMNQTI